MPEKRKCRNTGRTGFKKGQIPWNKGILMPKEQKRKVSESRKGKCMGALNPRWKGGKRKALGYFYILKHGHPFTDRDGYVKRSRYVMEKHIGRYLKPKERVHHMNGIKDDDRIENLKLFPNESKHQIYHFSNPIKLS